MPRGQAERCILPPGVSEQALPVPGLVLCWVVGEFSCQPSFPRAAWFAWVPWETCLVSPELDTEKNIREAEQAHQGGAVSICIPYSWLQETVTKMWIIN